MKRGTTGLCGVLAVDKPAGITSHDVVDAVRRLTGERRVGHAGTLDPMATGLMLVGVGAATRLSTYLTGHDKSYEARIVFGAATDTDDADGRIVTAYSGKGPGEGLSVLADLDPVAVLESIVGDSLQLPPAYSAIKKNGVTAYKAAREGKAIELEHRPITIYAAELLDSGMTEVDLNDGNDGRYCASLPYWDVMLHVSKGTYIRSIARDLGQRLGCGAHLGALRRISIADFSVEDACTAEQLAQSAPNWPWADPVRLLGFPVHEVDEQQQKLIGNGNALRDVVGYDGLVSCVANGRLLAIYEQGEDSLKPATVIPGGVCGVKPQGAVVKIWNLAEQTCASGPCVAAVGVFDGLHLGHRSLLEAARRDAAERNLPLAIVTFETDPDQVFGRPTQQLLGDKERLAALASDEFGAAEVLAVGSDKANFAAEPLEFLDALKSACDPAAIHVGEGFKFGAKASGTTADMQAWCDANGVDLNVHPLFTCDGAPVSATRVRTLIAEGDVRGAEKLLGHAHRVTGMVEHGRGEGTGFGFATANVRPAPQMALPKDGVYAAYARVNGKRYATAVNMGVAVSFDEAVAPIEAHLLEFSGDLYDREITLELVEHLRDQKKFDNTDELIATVMNDIQWVRDNLKEVQH